MASSPCNDTVLGSERTLEQLRRGCYAVSTTRNRIFPRQHARLCAKTLLLAGRAPWPSPARWSGQPTEERPPATMARHHLDIFRTHRDNPLAGTRCAL